MGLSFGTFYRLVGAVSFLGALLSVNPAYAQLRCETVFEAPAVAAAVDPKILEQTPPVTRLVIDRDSIRVFYERGRLNFENSLGDGRKFRARLRALARGEKADATTVAELKAFRKLAIILRSDFILLDEQHEVPEHFERFTKAFGKLNDALEFEAEGLVPAAAARVSELITARDLRRDLNSFSPATPKSVERAVNRVRDEIENLASEKTLSVHEFHEVRKLLKHILTFVQTAQSFDPAPEKVFAFQYLWMLNDTLGGLRQDVLKTQIMSLERGESPADDGKETQKLPGKLRSQIDSILTRLVITRPVADEREAMALSTHLRFDHGRETWQVLWPRKAGFEVLEYNSYEEASRRARKIEEPLDLEALRAQASTLLPLVRAKIETALGPKFDGRITARIKETESLKEKLFEKALAKGPKVPWTRITDILGLRVTVASEAAETLVAEQLKQAFRGVLVEEHERDEDHGYHAHHLVGELRDGPRFEIQVMTSRMAAWSDWEHDRLYKPVEPLEEEARDHLAAYARALAKALRRADQGEIVQLPVAEKYEIPARDQFQPAASF